MRVCAGIYGMYCMRVCGMHVPNEGVSLFVCVNVCVSVSDFFYELVVVGR